MTDAPQTLLVSMPWASTVRPSLGIGVLVAAARQHGFVCRSTYPNLLFSTLAGSEAYEYLAETPGLFGLAEHLFAVHIFGKERLDSDAYLAHFFQRAAPAADQDLAAGAAYFTTLRDAIVPGFIEECAATLLAGGPDIIGFSCTFNQVLPSLAVARQIKAQRPETIIVFGGACVHGKMGEAYARAFTEYIDHVFTGEADRTFIAFLNALTTGAPLERIPGLTVNGNLALPPVPVLQLEQVPAPDYDSYFSERAQIAATQPLAEFQNLPFEGSRGCWWGEKQHCTFCGLNNEGMEYRTKSPEKIVGELVELSSRYRTTNFMAADNILNFRSYSDLLPTIRDLPLDLNLFYEIKANLKRNQVAALAEAGVRWVQPGIESFSDHVLGLMHKGVTALQNIQSLKWMQEYGIHPSYNILVGFAGEEDGDYAEMLQLMQAITHLPPPSGEATFVQVHRFSPFYTEPERYGIFNLRAAGYYSHLIPPQILAGEEYAYFFERDLPPDAAVFRHIHAVNDLIRQWKATGRRLTAQLGAGSIVIQRVDEYSRQTTVLDLLASCIFILADRQITLETVTTQACRLLAVTATEVEQAIETLTAAGFVIAHANRLLAVVPFERPHRDEALEDWIATWIPGNVADARSGTTIHAQHANRANAGAC